MIDAGDTYHELADSLSASRPSLATALDATGDAYDAAVQNILEHIADHDVEMECDLLN